MRALLRQNPADQLPDFLVAQVGSGPHDEAIAPMARASATNDVRKLIAILRIASIVLGNRNERGPDVGATQRVAIEATLLFGELQTAIEIVPCVGERNQWNSQCGERAYFDFHLRNPPLFISQVLR
jgi:hypothetical protein